MVSSHQCTNACLAWIALTVVGASADVHAGRFSPWLAFQTPSRIQNSLIRVADRPHCNRLPAIRMGKEVFPDECCGPTSLRKVPTWGLDLPAWADALLAVVSVGGLLPAGIKVDEALQDGTTRIDSIANEIAPDGVRMYAAKPAGVLEGIPVVVLVHQFFGLRPRDVGLCDELAELGYLGIAPDCYGGATTTYVPRAISLVLPAAIGDKWEPHLQAVDSAVDWALSQPGVDPEKVYVAGFCFGGGVAVRYSQWRPEKVKACGVFYGKPVTQASTDLPPVYAVFGAKDGQFPPAAVDAFESELQRCGVRSEFRRYPDQGHAFVSDRKAIRDGDAKDAWEGWLAFCRSASSK